MLTFEPPELRDELLNALSIWDNFEMDTPHDIPEPEEWGFNSSEYNEVMTEARSVKLDLPGTQISVRISVREFIQITDEISTAKMIERRECITSQRAMIRVEAANEAAFQSIYSSIRDAESSEEESLRNELVAQQVKTLELKKLLVYPYSENEEQHKAYDFEDNLLSQLKDRFSKQTNRYFINSTLWNDQEVKVSLTTGFTIFGLILIIEGHYHKYDPHFTNYEYFVEIRHAGELDLESAQDIAAVYLFELAASYGTEYTISQRPETLDSIDDDGNSDTARIACRLRPLMSGKGIGELCKLYGKIVATADAEFQILYATKVIEYVSQTVIRMKAFESLRIKLLSPHALAPDARFLIELQGIAAKNDKITNDDKEAIKQTIITCCDATELARIMPPFLGEFRSHSLANDTQVQKGALSKFAISLYATRNEIAHAKANYISTGNECPKDLLTNFAECAKLAAQMAIRWYNGTTEENRIVG